MANRMLFLVAGISATLLLTPQVKSSEYYSPMFEDRMENSVRILQSEQSSFIGALSLSFTSTANFGFKGTCSGSVDLPATIVLFSDGTGEITIKSWNFWGYLNDQGNCNDQGFVPKSGNYTRGATHSNGQFRWETAVYDNQGQLYPGSEAVITGPFDSNSLTASGQSHYTSTNIACCGQSASTVLNFQIKAINQQTLPTDPAEYIILNVEEPTPSSQYSGVANIRGFSMAFNYSALNSGLHEIKIRAIDNEGASKEVSVSFEVIRFQNSFITDLGEVSFTNATCTINAHSINLNNMKVDDIGYDTILQWRTATQGLEFIRIVPHGQ